MAKAAGPFPLPSSPWQEAQYFKYVSLPDAVWGCLAAGFCSLFPCTWPKPKTVTNAMPKRITLTRNMGSFLRFAGVRVWVTTGVSSRSNTITVPRTGSLPLLAQKGIAARKGISLVIRAGQVKSLLCAPEVRLWEVAGQYSVLPSPAIGHRAHCSRCLRRQRYNCAAGNNLCRLRISTLAHFSALVGVNRNSARCHTLEKKIRRSSFGPPAAVTRGKTRWQSEGGVLYRRQRR